jgi:hypothetical protein
MTFGLRERNAREKADALNSGISNGKKIGRVPKPAARAFAIRAIRVTFTVDRPMIAIRNDPMETWESPCTIPRAKEPEPSMTTSAVFTKAQPFKIACV